MKKFTLLLLLLIAATTGTFGQIPGCMDPEALNYNPEATEQSSNTPCIYTYQLSQDTLRIPAEGNNGERVALIGTGYWQAETEAEWITLQPVPNNDGSGGSVIISATANHNSEARQAKVYIKNGEYTLAVITVIQEAPPIPGCMDPEALNYNPEATAESPNMPCVYPYQVSQDTLRFGYGGHGGERIALTGTGYWQAETEAEWITLFPNPNNDGGGMISIAVSENLNQEARQATVYIKNREYTLAVITVIQEAAPAPPIYGCMDSTALNYNPEATAETPNMPCVYPYQVSQDTLYVSAGGNGNGRFVTLIGKGYWNAEADADWVFVNPAYSSGGSERVNIVVRGHSGEEARQATVYFKAFEYTLASVTVIQEAAESGIYGCTDPYSLNYNPAASIDDGSCVYQTIEAPVEGCMDREALNYNPVATVSIEDSCVYAQEEPQTVCGCTDPKAANYNPNATEYLENSCYYSQPEDTYVEETAPEDSIVDIVGTQPQEDCQLTAEDLIEYAKIATVDINGTVVTIEWVIQQLGGGLPISYFADYIISNSGQYMFYLSIICKEMAEGQNAQVLSSTPAEAGVSTATVAASVYIDMNTTGIETIDYGLVGASASLRVSPNPTSGVITVEGCGDGFGVFGSGGNNSGGFGSGSDRGDATFASGAFGSGSSVSRSAACEISVYSSDGRLILRRRSNHIDLSAYPSGVYILRAGNKTARVVKK